MSVHQRIYRLLLVMYPPEHRDEYGEPMIQMLQDRLRDEGGGVGTAMVWAQVVTDLARTALFERMETTMETFKSGWWRVGAGFMALAQAVWAIGSHPLVDPDPNVGSEQNLPSALYLAAAGLIVAGLVVRKNRKALGSAMIGIGVLPGTLAITILWMPPVALIGVLAVFVAGAAFIDAVKQRRSDQLANVRP